MNVNIFDSVDQLNDQLIKFVLEIGKKAIAERGRFNFVLTGGSSPKKLYQELSTTYRDELDWSKVYFFFGDERYVPASHSDYNGKMAKETFFDNLSIDENQIFFINTVLSPELAAADYNKRIQNHFEQTKDIAFDLILLGMGDDAHTASIFPGTDLVKNELAEIAMVWVPKLDAYRISFTAKLINQAHHIAFITFGLNKAEALAKVLKSEQSDYSSYPAQLINPTNGTLDWFIDRAAASKID